MFTNKISATLDSNQPREQAGCRSGYPTTDYIHVIKNVVKKYAEYTKPLCKDLTDYEIAFVEASAVMKALRRQGIEEIYENILKDIYKEKTATVKLHKVSEKNFCT